MSTRTEFTRFIKSQAAALGFDFCGISHSRRLNEEEERLSNWLKKGFHGKMAYMENHFEKRLNPGLLVDGAKSVISFMISYKPLNPEAYTSELKVSAYARGLDYHYVIKEKLNSLMDELTQKTGKINYRIFVDSAPVLDRAWAVEAGLGWIGKNSMLISRKNGSFFFLAEIITDLELEYDAPFGGSYCGECTRCIDACPTGAIVASRTIDAQQCISYLTIELKESIPESFKGSTAQWIFGCDVCQDVCPWNRFSIATSVPAFEASHWITWSKMEWVALEEKTFNQLFSKSALKRAGFAKLKNSISFAVEIHDNHEG